MYINMRDGRGIKGFPWNINSENVLDLAYEIGLEMEQYFCVQFSVLINVLCSEVDFIKYTTSPNIRTETELRFVRNLNLLILVGVLQNTLKMVLISF